MFWSAIETYMLEIWCNYFPIKYFEKILDLCQTDKILNLSISYYQAHVFINGALGSIALISTCHLPASVRRVWAPSSVRRARADFKSILLLFLVRASDVQSLKPSACTLRYKHSHLNILQRKMGRSLKVFLLFLVHASDVQSLKPSACTLRYKHSHLNILQGKMRRSLKVFLLFLVHASDVQSLKPSACTLRYKHSHLNILQGKMRRSVRDYHTGVNLFHGCRATILLAPKSIPIN